MMEASDDDRSSHVLTCHTAPVRCDTLITFFCRSFCVFSCQLTANITRFLFSLFCKQHETGRHLRVCGRIESALSDRLAQIQLEARHERITGGWERTVRPSGDASGSEQVGVAKSGIKRSLEEERGSAEIGRSSETIARVVRSPQRRNRRGGKKNRSRGRFVGIFRRGRGDDNGLDWESVDEDEAEAVLARIESMNIEEGEEDDETSFQITTENMRRLLWPIMALS